MTKRTNDALEKVADGLEHLLSSLTAEPMLRIDFSKSSLKEACQELRDALQYEPMEKGPTQ